MALNIKKKIDLISPDSSFNTWWKSVTSGNGKEIKQTAPATGVPLKNSIATGVRLSSTPVVGVPLTPVETKGVPITTTPKIITPTPTIQTSTAKPVGVSLGPVTSPSVGAPISRIVNNPVPAINIAKVPENVYSEIKASESMPVVSEPTTSSLVANENIKLSPTVIGAPADGTFNHDYNPIWKATGEIVSTTTRSLAEFLTKIPKMRVKNGLVESVDRSIEMMNKKNNLKMPKTAPKDGAAMKNIMLAGETVYKGILGDKKYSEISGGKTPQEVVDSVDIGKSIESVTLPAAQKLKDYAKQNDVSVDFYSDPRTIQERFSEDGVVKTATNLFLEQVPHTLVSIVATATGGANANIAIGFAREYDGFKQDIFNSKPESEMTEEELKKLDLTATAYASMATLIENGMGFTPKKLEQLLSGGNITKDVLIGSLKGKLRQLLLSGAKVTWETVMEMAEESVQQGYQDIFKSVQLGTPLEAESMLKGMWDSFISSIGVIPMTGSSVISNTVKSRKAVNQISNYINSTGKTKAEFITDLEKDANIENPQTDEEKTRKEIANNVKETISVLGSTVEETYDLVKSSSLKNINKQPENLQQVILDTKAREESTVKPRFTPDEKILVRGPVEVASAETNIKENNLSKAEFIKSVDSGVISGDENIKAETQNFINVLEDNGITVSDYYDLVTEYKTNVSDAGTNVYTYDTTLEGTPTRDIELNRELDKYPIIKAANIPVSIKLKLITEDGRKAWGAYRNGGIALLSAENLPDTTIAHETVHGVLDLAYTEEERTNILSEARAKYNTDNDILAEEKFAEDVASMLVAQNTKNEQAQRNIATRVGVKLKGIIDDIVFKIRQIFGATTEIDKFYKEFNKPSKSRVAMAKEKMEGYKKGTEKPTQKYSVPSVIFREGGGTFTEETNLVARERFNLPELEKVSFGGSDRDVYDLGDYVLKVAKTARGLAQQDQSHDWYAEGQGLIPKTIEIGENYIVKEKVEPPNKETKELVKKLKEIGFIGERSFDEQQKAIEILGEYGLEGFGDYQPLWGDMQAIRNWGTKDGSPIMLDEGTLNGKFIEDYQGVKDLRDEDFRKVYYQSRDAKKKYQDQDNKTKYKVVEEGEAPTIKYVKVKTVPAEVAAEKIIDKKHPIDIVRGFIVKDGKLIATDLETNLTMNSTSLADGHYSLDANGIRRTNEDVDSFPDVTEITKNVDKNIKIRTEQFATAIAKNIKVVDSKNLRQEITGVLVDIKDGRMKVVGTDGYRLFYSTLDVDKNINAKFIISNIKKISKVLPYLGENLEIGTGNNVVIFSGENGTLVTRAIPGNYPNFEQIFPNTIKKYTVDKQKLSDAIKALKPYVPIDSILPTIKMKSGDGTIELSIDGDETKKIISIPATFNLEKQKSDSLVNNRELSLIMPVKLFKEDVVWEDNVGDKNIAVLNIDYLEDTMKSIDTNNINILASDEVDRTPLVVLPDTINKPIEEPKTTPIKKVLEKIKEVEKKEPAPVKEEAPKPEVIKEEPKPIKEAVKKIEEVKKEEIKAEPVVEEKIVKTKLGAALSNIIERANRLYNDEEINTLLEKQGKELTAENMRVMEREKEKAKRYGYNLGWKTGRDAMFNKMSVRQANIKELVNKLINYTKKSAPKTLLTDFISKINKVKTFEQYLNVLNEINASIVKRNNISDLVKGLTDYAKEFASKTVYADFINRINAVKTKEDYYRVKDLIDDKISNEEDVANSKEVLKNYIREYAPKSMVYKFLNKAESITNIDSYFKIRREIDDKITAYQKKSMVENVRKLFRQIQDSTVISVDYKEKARELFDIINISKSSKKKRAALESYKAFLDSQIEKGMTTYISDDLYKQLLSLENNSLENLSIQELESIMDSLRTLKEFGTKKQQIKDILRKNKIKQDVEDILNSEVTNVDPVIFKRDKGLLVKENRKNVEREIIKFGLKRMGISLKTIDSIFDKMDGSIRYAGTVYKVFKGAIDNSMRGYWKEAYTDKRVVQDILQEEWIKNNFNLNDASDIKIGAWGLLNSEGGYEKLVSEYGEEGILALYGKENMEDVDLNKSPLNSSEQRLYDAMRDTFDNLFPKVKKFLADVENKEIKHVKNYFPRNVNSEARDTLNVPKRLLDIHENSEGDIVYTTDKNIKKRSPNKGFTKSRVKNTLGVELSATSIFNKYVDDAAYLINMGETLKRLNSVISDKKVRAHLGEINSNVIDTYLEVMAAKGGSIGNGTIPLLDIIRKKVGKSIMLFNPSSTLVQPTSMLAAAMEIGGKYMMKGRLAIRSRNWDKIINSSYVLANRKGGDFFFSPDMSQYKKNLEGKTREEQLAIIKKLPSEWGFKLMKALDFVAAESTLVGAYMKYLDENNIELDYENVNEDAIRYAENILDRTQASTSFHNQPLAFTAGYFTGNESLDKALFQFQTFSTFLWNYIQHDIWESGIRKGDFKKTPRQVIYLASMFIVSNVIKNIIKDTKNYIFKGEVPEEPEDKEILQEIKDNLADFLLNIFGTNPIFNRIIQEAQYNGSGSDITALKTITDIVGIAGDLANSKTDKAFTGTSLKLIGALLKAAGFPNEFITNATNVIKSSEILSGDMLNGDWSLLMDEINRVWERATLRGEITPDVLKENLLLTPRVEDLREKYKNIIDK